MESVSKLIRFLVSSPFTPSWNVSATTVVTDTLVPVFPVYVTVSVFCV